MSYEFRIQFLNLSVCNQKLLDVWVEVSAHFITRNSREGKERGCVAFAHCFPPLRGPCFGSRVSVMLAGVT